MSFSVFLIDDDAGVLKALSRLLRASGYDPHPYLSPRRFLAEFDPSTPGCIVLDLTMPELDGLELQRMLVEQQAKGLEHQIIFVAGTGDISASVQAMKAGAIDFLTKPVDVAQLQTAIELARARDEGARSRSLARISVQDRIAKLTPREHEVLTHVLTGRLNKQIAAALGTTEKTIKVHRGRLKAKLGAHSVAELVRITDMAGVQPAA